MSIINRKTNRPEPKLHSDRCIFPLILKNDINIAFGTQLINIVQVPLSSFLNEKITINCVFKVRRNYKKILRRSDLSSVLSSQNYVKILRNDENISKCLYN